MDNFVRDLFNSRKPGYRDTDYISSDKIINEAILLDKVGADKMNALYEEIGSFGVRDGILGEKPVIPCEQVDHAQVAAILTAAKEANSPNYELYMRAKEAEKTYFAKMVEEFGDIANKKVDSQNKVIEINPRIQDAIDHVIADTKI